MKIDIQGIENMLVTSTINDYGVRRKKKKHKFKKTCFHSIECTFHTEIYFDKMNY